MLYDTSDEPGGRRYNFRHLISLAGGGGPLATFARTRNPANQVPFGWHASEEVLVGHFGGSPDKQVIVIDLKPRVTGNVSLYQLLDVWGYSLEEWTPVAVRLRALFADHKEPNPLTFKNSFVDPGTDHALVGEFLYMQGGVRKGKWTWGMVGRVNGALLWKDAFVFLTENLGKSL
jgi:hypothetical protein